MMATMEQVTKIGVMGARGSFSEQAGERYKNEEGLLQAEIVPLVSAENVLSALEHGDIERGIFPIENSNGGIVLEAVYAMAKHRFVIERTPHAHREAWRDGVARPDDFFT
jgi:prephenate dehydratase